MKLTIKEEQIISLAAAGLKDQMIAHCLGISVRTVQNHLSRIYNKTHTNNRVSAIILYLNSKIEITKRQSKKAAGAIKTL